MAFVPPAALTSSFSPSTRHTLCPSRSRYYYVRKAQFRMQKSSDEEKEVPISLSELNKSRSNNEVTPSTQSSEPDLMSAEDPEITKQEEMARLRAAEKFIEIDEGKYECTSCSYIYEPEKGDPRNSYAPGTQFEDLPDEYSCPVCRTPKRRFIAQKKIIAGFADNQTYGFGSNTLTGGQKNSLIFGALALCALLLLSGYGLN